MRDRYPPHNDPALWSPFPPDRAARDPYLDRPAAWDEPPDAVRAAGLRRLSRLTWRATQLGAIATVGFATLFARTAPAQTVSTPAAKPIVKASTASPSPSPAKTHHRRHHRHHHPRPVAGAPAPVPSSAGNPAPAPPTTAPAAPPPPPPSAAPSPSHTSSGGSHGGG